MTLTHLILSGDRIAWQHPGYDVASGVDCVGDGAGQVAGQGGLELVEHVHLDPLDCHSLLHCY